MQAGTLFANSHTCVYRQTDIYIYTRIHGWLGGWKDSHIDENIYKYTHVRVYMYLQNDCLEYYFMSRSEGSPIWPTYNGVMYPIVLSKRA